MTRHASATAGCRTGTDQLLATRVLACFRDSNLRGVAQFVRFTAILVLFLTAAAKAYTLFQGDTRFSLRDPVLSYLSQRQVLTLAVVFEVILVFALAVVRRPYVWCGLISWASAVFLLYRFGLYLYVGSGLEGCPCLGSVPRLLGVGARQLSTALSFIAVAWLLVSASLFLPLWWAQRKEGI